STGPLSFTIGDAETPAEALTVTGDSSDHAIVPAAKLVFGGSGSNRTVRVSPAADRFGTVTIFITVRDLDGGATTNRFQLTIRPVNDPPSIAPIADASTLEDTSLVVGFVVSDLETPADALVYTAASSDPALIPPASIVFSGTGANRLATITPATNQFGT